MRKVLTYTFVCFLGAICAGATKAQERPIDFSSRGANVFGAPGAQSLSLPSQTAPAAVVATFLRSRGFLPETVASLVVKKEGRVSRTGITHLRLAQEVEGLTVYGTYVKAAVNDDGELVHLIENLATPSSGGLMPTAIGDSAALDAALDEVHPGVSVNLNRGWRNGNTTHFLGDEFFYQDPSVTRVAIPMESGVLEEGYLVETWSEEANLLHHTLIDGTGQVLQVELRTNNESHECLQDCYNIFPEYPDPLSSNQIVAPGPGIGTVLLPAIPESPIGWLDLEIDGITLIPQSSVDISGNNAHAYLDVNNDNGADPSIGFSIPDGNFLTEAKPDEQPNSLVNQEVAVQNLFYFNNVIHDKLYSHGFDEAAGNFQEDNFGNGGTGNDSVDAEAQDGGGFNNANFATPGDGSRPRMQMYLWDPSDFSLEIAGGATYDAVPALFGPSPTDGLMGAVVIANDDISAQDGGTPSDGCEAIDDSVYLKIALIDRGHCDFVVKVQNAQTAGAIGVIVANNEVAAISGMADNGDGYAITIPSLFISMSDGDAIKTLLAGGTVTATLKATQFMRDGDVDSDIIWHEYGHGLTWRMIGGMTGSMSGAIGEGMSDVLAILANNEDRVGEYSTGTSTGIRSAPYTNYSRTYGDFTGGSVHFNGEIYAATIWRLWELFQGAGDAGISQDTLFNYLIDGMNFTPSGPTFEDMRDGILQAASGSGHECLIWDAFAAFGVGVDAGAQIHKKFGWRITESFDLPIDCQGQPGNAPAVSLMNILVTSLAENADTSSRTKVADIVVTDSDGGTNNLTLRGPDSSYFEIDDTELFLKVGVALVASSTLNVTVDVDDPMTVAMPDDSDSLAINITAVGATLVNLTGSNSNNGRTWTAIMGVEVLNGGDPVDGITVEGSSTEGQCDQPDCKCTTDSSGQCSLSASGIRKNIGATVFTVLEVVAVYDESSITIFKP